MDLPAEAAALSAVNDAVIDLTEEQPVADNADVAVVWAFLWHFSPLRDLDDARYASLWPQTADEFEAALLQQEAPEEEFSSKAPYVPTLVPILEWMAEMAQLRGKSSREKRWQDWCKSWTYVRMRSADRKLSEHWGGENKLEQAGGFYGLGWEDRAMIMKMMTDVLLTNVEPIRDVIAEQYDIVAGKELKRTPADNNLVVLTLGKDSKRQFYYKVDDSPRVWRSANFYKRPCPLVSCARSAQEVEQLVDSLHAPRTREDVAPIFKKQKKDDLLAHEHALRHQLETEVIAKLPEGVERMEAVMEERAAFLKEREQEELKELKKQQLELLNKQRNEERQARLRAPRHKLDYVVLGPDETNVGTRTSSRRGVELADIDSPGASSDADSPRRASPAGPARRDAPRKRRRGPSTDDADDDLFIDDPELLMVGRSRRQSPAELPERRSGRHGGHLTNGFLSAVIEEPGFARSTRARASADESAKLPRGADKRDYNLLYQQDTVVWKGSVSKVLKGSLTAQAELALELAQDAHQRVADLEEGRDVPAGNVPIRPPGSNDTDYELRSIEDTLVWSRGTQKPVKGLLTAAREIAALLDRDADRVVQIAMAEGAAEGHPPSVKYTGGAELSNAAELNGIAPTSNGHADANGIEAAVATPSEQPDASASAQDAGGMIE